MERPLSLNLDSLPVNIMSESARKKYTEVFTKQNCIAENGKSLSSLEIYTDSYSQIMSLYYGFFILLQILTSRLTLKNHVLYDFVLQMKTICDHTVPVQRSLS